MITRAKLWARSVTTSSRSLWVTAMVEAKNFRSAAATTDYGLIAPAKGPTD